jgi:hypothetical protein
MAVGFTRKNIRLGRDNYVRKGLCRSPMNYPFLGSFTDIGRAMLGRSVEEMWIPPWKREGKKAVPR